MLYNWIIPGIVSKDKYRKRLTVARRRLVPFVVDANGNGISAQHVIILTAVSKDAV